MEVILFFMLFSAMLFFQHWLQQHIQGAMFAVTGNPGCAVRALFLLLLPGVLLHEFSHWFIANLLGVRTGKISIGLGKLRGNKHFSLGSVTIERTDPLRESLIGIAPFISGLAAIWLLMGVGFSLWAPNDPLRVAETLWASVGDPLTWLALYLVFAVSTSMIPSASDREPWGISIAILGGVGAFALILGWAPSLSPEMIEWGRRILYTLIFVLSVIVVVNGALAGAIFIFEWLFGAMTQRKVRY